MTNLRVTIHGPQDGALLAPLGLTTPYDAVISLDVSGGVITRVLRDADLGLGAIMIAPEANEVTLTYTIAPAPRGASYPEAAFHPRKTRFTEAAAELARASREIAAAAGGGQPGIAALVAEAEARFTYDHPDTKFYDGLDAIPHLSCGLTPGSCVDINMYLIASLRAAGYEAAYIYGYFFPQERNGYTDDGHCWVVTRHQGQVLEWDIAHHLKARLGPTRAGLNPRPGARVAMTHSMGHLYALPEGTIDLKLLGEPMRLCAAASASYVRLSAELRGTPT